MKLKLLSAVAALVACSGAWAQLAEYEINGLDDPMNGEAVKLGVCMGLYTWGDIMHSSPRLRRLDNASVERIKRLKIEFVERLDDPANAFYLGESLKVAETNNFTHLSGFFTRSEDWEAEQDRLLTKSGCENL